MGNRTGLEIGDCSEFEAKNCLPVTWLALFDSQDFIIETQVEDGKNGEEYQVAFYRTDRESAFNRAEKVIELLKGRTSAWAYLRPIEILRDEINFCLSSEPIRLDVTQLWALDEDFDRKISHAVNAFQEMINSFTGDVTYDISLLDKLVNDYGLGEISSIVDATALERMFILIGTYFGPPEREDLYSEEYFNDAYWKES